MNVIHASDTQAGLLPRGFRRRLLCLGLRGRFPRLRRRGRTLRLRRFRLPGCSGPATERNARAWILAAAAACASASAAARA